MRLPSESPFSSPNPLHRASRSTFEPDCSGPMLLPVREVPGALLQPSGCVRSAEFRPKSGWRIPCSRSKQNRALGFHGSDGRVLPVLLPKFLEWMSFLTSLHTLERETHKD